MAIQELPNLQTTPSDYSPFEKGRDDSVDLGEVIGVLYRRRWIMLVVFLAIFGLGVAYTMLKTRIYQATCSILVTPSTSKKADDLPLFTDLENFTRGRSVDTQVEILSSSDLLETAYTDVSDKSLMTEADRLVGFKSAHHPAWAVAVATKKNTDIINVTVRAYSPEGAANYANNIAQTFIQQNLLQNQKATKEAREFVETQLAEARQRFDRTNTELTQFKQESKLVSPDVQLQQVANNAAAIQMSLTQARSDAEAAARSLESCRAQLQRVAPETMSNAVVAQNPRIAASLQRLDDLYSQRTRMLQDYTPQSPEIAGLDARIAAEQATLKSLSNEQATVTVSQTRGVNPVYADLLKQYVDGQVARAAAGARVRALEAATRQFGASMGALPAKQQKLAALMLDMELLRNTVEMLTQRQQTLLISEQSTLPDARIISGARPSGAPVAPRVRLNLFLFGLLAVLCCVGLALLIERLDDRFFEQEVAERLTGLVTMGVIHALEEDEARIIPVDDKRSQLLERFRVLRNNISFSGMEKQMRLIAVTSSGPGEGKSTCCTNLGIVMAMDGKRVLIVDTDLHRPNVHTLLKVPRNVGMTNVLMGSAALEDVVATTEYPNLFLLPAGTLPPNPSEFLNAKTTRRFFRELGDKYDMVLFDCPPCLKLSDVQIISTIVDGVLLLASVNQTAKRGLLFAYHSLMQVSAPLIGLVINRVDVRQHGYGAYRYYSKYGYYGYYYYTSYDQEDGGEPARKRVKKRKRLPKSDGEQAA